MRERGNMASLLSSTLRAINREPNSTLNILIVNCDEAFQSHLCSTKHVFYLMSHPQIRPWNQALMPIPKNCIPLSGKEIKDQLKQDIQFDLILCQDRTHFPVLFKIAKQIGCPIVMAENDLANPDLAPHMIESLASQPYNVNVFNSEFLANSWGFESSDDDTFVVPLGINTNIFDGWIGGDGKVLTIVDNYMKRDSLTGFKSWSEITNGLPTNPWGNTEGFSKPVTDCDQLVLLYRNCSVFLNTSSWIACPRRLLEAMSTGCPVVSTATTIMPDIIEDGVNGYISYDTKDLREKIIYLLEHPKESMELGRNARKTIEDLCCLSKFKEQWDEIFETAVGQPSCAVVAVT